MEGFAITSSRLIEESGIAGPSGHIGIKVSLIANTFSVEITHSEAAPNASDAATASINRGETVLAGRQAKPAPDDRIMIQFPDISRANHREEGIIEQGVGKIAALGRSDHGKSGASAVLSPLSP